MSIPIPTTRGKPSASAPIPIAARRTVAPAVKSSMSYLSASVPAAPIIGSLKAPSQLESTIPDLSLPPASPEAFSLAAVNTEELSSRLVGVSSAPARTFIEHARRSSASVPLGTSPTVLSILGSRAMDDSLAKSKLSREAPPERSPMDVTAEGGLSAIFKKGAVATQQQHTAHATPTGHHQSSLTMPVVLAASFRDTSKMTFPLAATITEDDEESLIDSDSDVESKHNNARVTRRRADSEEEEHHTTRPERAPSDRDEGIFFEGEFQI